MRDPMIRGESGGCDNEASNGPMRDVLANCRWQALKKWLLMIGHMVFAK